MLRKIVILVLSAVVANVLRLHGLFELCTFLTNWALISTLVTAILGHTLGSNPAYTQSLAPNLHSLHHLFYTLMMFLNPIIVSVYWAVIHKEHVQELTLETKGHREDFQEKIIHTYLVHTVPFLCSVLIMIISDTVLIRRHSIYLIWVGVFYSYSNYQAV